MNNSLTMSSVSQCPDSTVKNRFLGLTVFLIIAVMYMLSDVSSTPNIYDLLCLTMIASTVTMIFIGLAGKCGSINLHLNNPLTLYGFFYFLYYLFPYLLFFLTGNMPEDNKLHIAFLLLIGYVSWYFGVKISGIKQESVFTVRFGEKEARALLALCIIGIGLIVYIYAWRTSQGLFFTHSRHYEQELTVASSFRDVFVDRLQLPIILLLGLLSAVKHKRISMIAYRLLISYGAGIVLIYVFGSQTRPAITAMVFILLSLNMRRSSVLKVRHIMALVVTGILIIAFIQGVRADSSNIVSADNQFTYAVKGSVSDAAEGFHNIDSEQMEELTNRMGGSLLFLSAIIDATGESGTYLYGNSFVTSLFSLVPRFVWPDKPAVVASDLIVQDLLGMPQYDSTLGPIIQFYVEAGVTGIIIGYALFGWCLGTITKKTAASGKPGLWIIVVFIWGYISNLELEVLLGGLATFRNACVVYIAYQLLLYVTRHRLYGGRQHV